MHCNKCGKSIEIDATFCTRCGNKINISEQHTDNNGVEYQIKPTALELYKKYIIIGVAVILFVMYFFGIRCKSGLCLLPSGFSGEYCVIHTCGIDSCTNKKATDKSYCYTHSPSTTSGLTYTPESAEDVLEFSDIEVTNNTSYTICTGTITNNGRKTYTFVEVKGKFKDSSGTVLDTDWTYAVGSEGLSPNESTTFRLSVDKDYNIRNCSLEILDYDKE